MKVIVAGGRSYEDYEALVRAIEASSFAIDEIVSGACGVPHGDRRIRHLDSSFEFAKGADGLGERWAAQHGIPFVRFFADWTIGRHAGPLRNQEMAEYADALIALPGGRGTASMVRVAKRRRLKVFIMPGAC